MKDREREIMLDIVRVTETAALRAARLMGTGDNDAIDGAAVDGMKGMLELVDINGVIAIGEGEKDKAPMLHTGEKVGNGNSSCQVDIAVDPVEGTRLVASGLPNALSVMVVAAQGTLMRIPCFYMKKIAVGPQARGYIDINVSVRENIKVIAARLGKRPKDITVAILDRPRHSEMINEIRATGARIKLLPDGDVAGSIATCLPDSGVDVLMGIGGAPEGVLSAAAIKCLGGEFQGCISASSDSDIERAKNAGIKDINKVYTAGDLVKGDSVIFAATAITDGDLLRGVRFHGSKAVTQSMVMRARTGTLRIIETHHDLLKKTIRSASMQEEVSV